MPAGYSGTPLIRKLGIRPGMRLRFINEPEHYRALLGTLPDDLVIARATRGHFDFIHLFVDRHAELRRQIPRLIDAIRPDGMLWVSWPKKASGVATDITEDVIREEALLTDLVDVKVCAVDETWSGLKLVIRTARR